MKILIINQHISQALGGSEMQCDIIAREFSKRGHDVFYATPSSMPFNAEGSPYSLVFMTADPLSIFAEIKPDIIYWRYNKIGLLRTVLAAKKLNIPFVYAISSKQDPQVFGWRYQRKKNWIKGILRVFKQITISAWNYRGLLRVDALTSLNSRYLENVPVKNKHVVYNAVYTEYGDIEPPKSPFVLWVSNLKSTKRPEIFIELAQRFKGSNLRFVMIGRMNYAYNERVQKAEQELINFEYWGQVSPQQVNTLLKSALCLVHTCKPEGFGNIFIQAWFQGCPTISYSFDPDNFIRSQSLGFVSNNIENLVEDLKKLENDNALRKEISDNARNIALALFTRERLGHQLEDLFTNICKKIQS